MNIFGFQFDPATAFNLFRGNYYIKGLEKMREYSWEEAIKSFQIALVGNPPDNEKMVLDFLIGLCYHNQDKLDQALGNYKLTTLPKSPIIIPSPAFNPLS